MEDYEAQEIEFWAKLEEEGYSRSSMLRSRAGGISGAACGRAWLMRDCCAPPSTVP